MLLTFYDPYTIRALAASFKKFIGDKYIYMHILMSCWFSIRKKAVRLKVPKITDAWPLKAADWRP